MPIILTYPYIHHFNKLENTTTWTLQKNLVNVFYLNMNYSEIFPRLLPYSFCSTDLNTLHNCYDYYQNNFVNLPLTKNNWRTMLQVQHENSITHTNSTDIKTDVTRELWPTSFTPYYFVIFLLTSLDRFHFPVARFYFNSTMISLQNYFWSSGVTFLLVVLLLSYMFGLGHWPSFVFLFNGEWRFLVLLIKLFRVC